MKYNAFISYADADKALVENLRDHLCQFGVNAWVYSHDRTLAEDAWEEIKMKIKECNVVIFVVSNNTPNAQGQRKELELALDKIEPAAGAGRIFPIVVEDTQFSSLPEKLRYKNGLRLDNHSMKSNALAIARLAFPGKLDNEIKRHWKHPVPGEWLEVSNLDTLIEEDFNLGDPLYFRQISPMGLFECYSPNIAGLFWILPDNVRIAKDPDRYEALKAEIPFIYRVSGMIEIQRLGWNDWHKKKENDS